MTTFDHSGSNDHLHQDHQTGQEASFAGDIMSSSFDNISRTSISISQGSSIRESDTQQAIEQTSPITAGSSSSQSPDAASQSSSNSGDLSHLPPDALENAKTIDSGSIQTSISLDQQLGETGDLLDGGAGTNTLIGSSGNDILTGQNGFNTATGGNGNDLFILNKETTFRVFDFNAQQDKFGLGEDLADANLIIGQGTNEDKGGINQPLDSVNNVVILDGSDPNQEKHILASLTFAKAEDLNESNFVQIDSAELDSLSASEAKSANSSTPA